MIITTTENIPSKEYEIIGLVSGTITQSKSMLKDFGAGFKAWLVAKSNPIQKCKKMLEKKLSIECEIMRVT